MEKRTSSFLKGTLLGTIIGAAAGILFAPKAGKETREDIKKAAQDVAKRAGDAYDRARSLLDAKVEALKKAGKKIDQKKYGDLIREVVDELKDDKEVTADASRKAAAQLKRDWKKVSAALQAQPSK